MKQTTVQLPIPIKVGETEITSVNIRKPKAGEMRGLKTMDLLQMDINAHATLIPRICPDISLAVYNELEPENLTAIQGAVVNFFVNVSA
jgi:predicted fused transcriptional regulator/phosphomethylpyrimidine kinase